MTIEILKAEIDSIDQQLQALESRKAELVSELKEAELELSKAALDQIVAQLKALNVDPTAIAKALGIPVADSAGKKPRAARGTAVPKVKGVPKYRNSVDPSLTWTGKGRKPEWVVTYVENKGALEDLLIKD